MGGWRGGVSWFFFGVVDGGWFVREGGLTRRFEMEMVVGGSWLYGDGFGWGGGVEMSELRLLERKGSGFVERGFGRWIVESKDSLGKGSISSKQN